MSLTINTNLSSFIAQSSLKSSTSSLNQAIERMSTGFKINHAKDNAAGYSIANSMSSKLSSYEVTTDNTSYGLELISTATSNLDLITSHLQRIRDLAEQASNGTYGADSLAALQSEVEVRMKEVDRIISNTEYNGISLYKGEKKLNIDVDESKRVVNQTTFQSGKTYYLTESEDLVKLQDLVNSGVDTTNVTFELVSDIDMKGVVFRGIGIDFIKSFKGTFNGNQCVIKNLTIDTTGDKVGLFGCVIGGKIDSVGLENADIKGKSYVGGLVGDATGSITNSYVTGSVSGTDSIGGLVGNASGSITNSYASGSVIGVGSIGGLVGRASGGITNSYATGSVEGSQDTGGLVGGQYGGSIMNSYAASSVNGRQDSGGLVGGQYTGSIINSFSLGNVSGTNRVGGLSGNASGSITNSYAIGNVTGSFNVAGFVGYAVSNPKIDGYFDTQKTGKLIGVGTGSYTGIVTGVTSSELQDLINSGILPGYGNQDDIGVGAVGGGREFVLQVGIDSSEYSQIKFDTMFELDLSVDLTTQAGALQAITDIDNALKSIESKQTELGATENKLMSVLDALSINIENLTSSLSTIRDADIAEESSEYIRNQILQQASATLLSTANQNPSIALQLL